MHARPHHDVSIARTEARNKIGHTSRTGDFTYPTTGWYGLTRIGVVMQILKDETLNRLLDAGELTEVGDGE